MKNLAGHQKADETILEELYLANIPAIKVNHHQGEVPYSYVGKIGKWTFKRAWYYWIVSVEDGEMGLPLKIALELHNRKHPTKDEILGKIIRSGGHGGCLSPDEYGAQPIYNDELDKQLESIGYEKHYCEFINKDYISITVGEVSKLCNEGKLNVERYVDYYHIDEQIGLNEFANTIKEEGQF
jgi:hypothetical protein